MVHYDHCVDGFTTVTVCTFWFILVLYLVHFENVWSSCVHDTNIGETFSLTVIYNFGLCMYGTLDL